jgi:N12 class adenine-specific DNA methylase
MVQKGYSYGWAIQINFTTAIKTWHWMSDMRHACNLLGNVLRCTVPQVLKEEFEDTKGVIRIRK